MALYVSAGRRARRTAIIAAVAAVIALAFGWAIGRAQVPSVDDRVAEVADRGRALATRIERLDIEYAQAVSGSGDDMATAVVRPLRADRRDLQSTMDRAPWIGPASRAAVLDALAAVESATAQRVPVEEFRAEADAAGALIREELGG